MSGISRRLFGVMTCAALFTLLGVCGIGVSFVRHGPLADNHLIRALLLGNCMHCCTDLGSFVVCQGAILTQRSSMLEKSLKPDVMPQARARITSTGHLDFSAT